MNDTPGPAQRTGIPAVLRLLGATRYLIVVASLAILLAATTLLFYGAAETFAVVHGLFDPAMNPSKGAKGLSLEFIEITDLFLLATVLYVIAIGLFELFVDDRLRLPAWLAIHDLDDLKQKLIGVVIVVMAVVYLGEVVTWDGQRDLLGSGAGIALVIAALTYFLRQKPKSGS